LNNLKPPITFLDSKSNKVTKVSKMLSYSPTISFDLPFSIPIIYYKSDLENLKMSTSLHFTAKIFNGSLQKVAEIWNLAAMTVKAI